MKKKIIITIVIAIIIAVFICTLISIKKRKSNNVNKYFFENNINEIKIILEYTDEICDARTENWVNINLENNKIEFWSLTRSTFPQSIQYYEENGYPKAKRLYRKKVSASEIEKLKNIYDKAVKKGYHIEGYKSSRMDYDLMRKKFPNIQKLGKGLGEGYYDEYYYFIVADDILITDVNDIKELIQIIKK